MTGSAQLDTLAIDQAIPQSLAVPLEAAGLHATALKLQAAERVAAHRLRRQHGTSSDTSQPVLALPHARKLNPVAAAVAERYAHSPSYRAFLAEEAERAIEQSAAAAEIAARNAQAVAAVQQELLAELEQWPEASSFDREDTSPALGDPRYPHAFFDPAPQEKTHFRPVSRAELTVRLYEEVSRPAGHASQSASANFEVEDHASTRTLHSLRTGSTALHQERAGREDRHRRFADFEETCALDDEIAFRQAPVFDDFGAAPPREPAIPLPANLLEFPRQLVATRRARPRLAEGPLSDEATPSNPQLRIFEVESDHLSTAPAPAQAAPEWTSIWLDAHTMEAPAPDAHHYPTSLEAALLPPQSASFPLRLKATAVDAGLVASASIASVVTLFKLGIALPTGVLAAIAAGGTYAVLYLLYQFLFFTLSDHTPGMRFARIGLCTFTDENPSRSAMRVRIAAQLLAACPLGLGFLWALLDDDRLGWHDRISKMYQRAY